MSDKPSKWFSEAALKIESFYVQHNSKIDRVSTIGRIWGTRVEDLKSPMGVAGRLLRTVPEIVGLARSFSQEPNALYAEAILRQELPHIVLGTMVTERHSHDAQENLNTSHLVGLLRGIASVLSLKVEDVPLFHESGGKVEISAIKIHLGGGVVLGTLIRPNPDYSPLYAPLFSTHDAEASRAHLLELWRERGIVGLEIKTDGEGGGNIRNRGDFSSSTITQINEGEVLVVGSEFSNDYRLIAKRVKRFEKAGYKRNLMLLGPPGCGKTSIAQQIAREIGRFTVNVESSLLASSVLIQVLTHFFPDIILICDDFDRYHGDTQSLLSSLEKTGSSLIVTCNTIYGFDKAAVRVGRIDEIIDVPKPDLEMRRRLFLHFCALTGNSLPDDEELEGILRHTDGFTPAEMREVVKCFEVLGFEDSKLEIKRLRRQSKMAESLWYKLDWAGIDSEKAKSMRKIATTAFSDPEPDIITKEGRTPTLEDDEDDDDW